MNGKGRVFMKIVSFFWFRARVTSRDFVEKCVIGDKSSPSKNQRRNTLFSSRQSMTERKAIHSLNLEQLARAAERFRFFEYVIENGFKLPLEPFQRLLSQRVTKLFAPEIIGSQEWDVIGASLCKEQKWDKLYKVVAAVVPALYGKKFVMARIIAARMEAFIRFGNPNTCDTQAVCLKSIREAMCFRTTMLSFLGVRGLLQPHMIMKLNSETIVLTMDRNDVNASITTVMFFHPNSKFLRGFNPDVMWVKSDRMDKEVTNRCILPLLEIPHFKMVLFSSPTESPSCIFTYISTLRDQTMGPPETEFINVTSICDECKVGGYPEECHHNDRFRPTWFVSPPHPVFLAQIISDTS